MTSLSQLFAGLYKRCECGHCNELIKFMTSDRRPAKFKNGHNAYLRLKDKHPNWKGGRYKCGDYWWLNKPGYSGSNKYGQLREHKFIYEQHHKLCMLKWGHIHHLDGNTENNNIENLQGMMNYQHSKTCNKKNIFDRRCSECNNDKTYINEKRGWPEWRLDGKGGWLCKKCADARYRRSKGIRPKH